MFNIQIMQKTPLVDEVSGIMNEERITLGFSMGKFRKLGMTTLYVNVKVCIQRMRNNQRSTRN